ncbi:helix-turn-helix domain-containing protein [Phreatobacter aquaticus]|uniref:Helix-turn-helix domain-containing protein n=1 Tax=Phreatobacter aquaticus TaxID=2570229 RepID=A0A4D7QEL2_9HYPH|nr:helix-turn-helix domain-containing protein [Phreatobacter aquaticus]QCK85225.1 helix-turn-helix domain-containing protein [Phreatobacter aquaticus]
MNTNTPITAIATKPARRLIAKTDVCDAYVISPATLDRLIRHKGFPHIKIGSRTLFRVEDVEAFFAGRVRCNS